MSKKEFNNRLIKCSDSGRTFESSDVKKQNWQCANVCLDFAKPKVTFGWRADEGTIAERLNMMALDSDSFLAS